MDPYLPNSKEAQDLESLEVDFHYTAEAGGFWPYVGSKDNQRWTWYGYGQKPWYYFGLGQW